MKYVMNTPHSGLADSRLDISMAADAQRPAHQTVTVNTEEKIVDSNFLDFHQVCLLAFPQGPFGDGIVYSVLYHYMLSPTEN